MKNHTIEMTKENKAWLEPPRWPGGPLICGYENLPAYVTLAEVKHWQEQCHSAVTKFVWRCHACGMLHDKFIGLTRNSGTGSTLKNMLKPYKVRAEREGRTLNKVV